MIYGNVVETEQDGRKATVDVISYAGPGKPPRTIHMPVTVDDRDQYPAGDSCPDFSMKFEAGAEYVFFLADIPPNLALLAPSWITAAPVDSGQMTVTVFYPKDNKDDLHTRLKDYADFKGYEIQSPSSHSPIWGGGSGSGSGWHWYAVSLAALSLGLLTIYAYKKRTPK